MGPIQESSSFLNPVLQNQRSCAAKSTIPRYEEGPGEVHWKVGNYCGGFFYQVLCTLKSFIFNFTSQILYNSSMIAHFVQDFSPTCKRCEYARLLPAPKETLLHIFWDCPCIQEIISGVKRLISNDRITENCFREILFLGSVSNLKFNIKKTNLICMTALFFIFSTRNKNSTYNINKLYDFLNFHTNNILSFIN